MQRFFTATVGCVITIIATSVHGAQLTETDGTFHDGFESGLVDQRDWRPIGNDTASIANTPLHFGNYSSKIVLNRYGDRDPYRTELRKKGHFKYGREYSIGVAIYVPRDWDNDPASATVVQIHGLPDRKKGEKNRSAAIALRIKDDYWRLQNRWDSRLVSTRSSIKSLDRNIGSLQKGRWTHFKFRFKLSYNESGLLEVWKDGSKVFSKNGPNTYNDATGPFLKMGIYVPIWKPANRNSKAARKSKASSHTLFFDSFKITSGSGSLKKLTP